MREIGLKHGIVKLSEYRKGWVSLYEVEHQKLKSALSDFVSDIQHIGSTSVPGLYAKPIIDIIIGVKILKNYVEYIDILKIIGYKFREYASEPNRKFFAKGNNNFRTHHLHIVEIDTEEWNKHIIFRDYLIDHKETADKYASLKYKMSKKFPEDRNEYTVAKSRFINMIVDKAKKEVL
jgi:GrpB-like predicted nucleotidyltransferase (UPF0157 family)